ncbi:peptidase MA family metallohydrolase [Chloroflexota bacterium]
MFNKLFVSKLAVFLLYMVLTLSISARRVFAQSGIHLMENKVVLQFPDGIQFQLSVASDVEIETIDLIYGTDGRNCQSSAARQPMDFESASEVAVDWDWEWIRSGVLPPGVEVWWQWEIVDVSGKIRTSPKEKIVVQDQRHDWNVISRNGVTLQWYSGDQSFGNELHNIATDILGRIENEMRLKVSDEIQITVYPTAEDVREALLVATEWTGGVAFPDHNSMIIGIGPYELDWAVSIIPHEINHLVVGALTFNCYGVRFPTWLIEGLAEISEAPQTQEQLDIVISSIEDGSLPSLNTLVGRFSAYGNSARLSYLQSKVVVQFLIDEYGADKLADLLAVMQAGVRIDLALEQVYGFDTQGLDAVWRSSLGFSVTIENQASEIATATRTLVPTLAPLLPSFQPSATSAQTITARPRTPTMKPTPAVRTLTPGRPTLTTDAPETAPQVESQPASPATLIITTIFGISLVSLILLYFLYTRKKIR